MVFSWLVNTASVLVVGFWTLTNYHISIGDSRSPFNLKSFILLGTLVPLTLYGVYSGASQRPISSQPLGSVVGVVVDQGGFLSPTLSTIETGSGFYTLRGSVSASRGDPVRLNGHHLGITRICVAARCYPKAS